jgi:hypothetical protein
MAVILGKATSLSPDNEYKALAAVETKASENSDLAFVLVRYPYSISRAFDATASGNFATAAA